MNIGFYQRKLALLEKLCYIFFKKFCQEFIRQYRRSFNALLRTEYL
ncbi:Uncharacterized protein dnm_058090 [Desulfonema magnum]|uniref:Uncharacterized protein n=1 Tax=Desulfonema magnum TaxID=45655 RepID=A0A975BQC8_9BACT|nr:Uncharacterized protein dnm_058090 [Desulfonema magnum]